MSPSQQRGGGRSHQGGQRSSHTSRGSHSYQNARGSNSQHSDRRSNSQHNARGSHSQHNPGGSHSHHNARGSHFQQNARGSHSQQNASGSHFQQNARGSNSQQSRSQQNSRESNSKQNARESNSQQNARGSNFQKNARGSNFQENTRGSHSQKNARGSHSHPNSRVEHSQQNTKGRNSQQSTRRSHYHQSARSYSYRRCYSQHSYYHHDTFVTVPSSECIPSQLFRAGHNQSAAKEVVQDLEYAFLGTSMVLRPSEREKHFPSSNIFNHDIIQKQRQDTDPSYADSMDQIASEKGQREKQKPRIFQNFQQQFNRSCNLWKKKKVEQGQQQNLLTFTLEAKTTRTVSSHDVVDDDDNDDDNDEDDDDDNDDDDETSTTFSHCSSLSSAEMSDKDSEGNSDDSQIANVLSHTESFDTMETYSATESQFGDFGHTLHENKIISVYWDIENCPVPNRKSAVDIVKKIRHTFYDGRTENSFMVACDTRNLSTFVEKELSESDVTLVHANSQSKNAADSKLQKFLHQFMIHFGNKDAAIVLISGDSDFSAYVNQMRYQHRIYINLICNQHARKALKEAAHRCILYEDFIKDLPDRSKDEKRLFFLIISDFPNYIKTNAIKSCLAQKIQGINGKISKVSSSEMEILFSNESTCRKALLVLEGADVYGSKVSVKLEVRNSVHKEDKKNILKGHSVPVENSLQGVHKEKECIKSKIKRLPIVQKKEQDEKQNGTGQVLLRTDVSNSKTDSSVAAKSATLYIFVSNKQGDVTHWEKEFINLFGNTEISVQWCETGFVGYFLVKFKSLSKAQKARKLLETNQKIDNNAPKFLKLVKEDSGLDLSITNQCDLKEISMKKIEEKIHCIQMKKEKCIKNFQVLWDSLKRNSMNDACGISSALSSSDHHAAFEQKQAELNEQKVAFLNFSENICKKLKCLDLNAENIDSMIDDIIKDYHYECMCFESRLPVYGKKNLIIKKIRKYQVIIIQAETGSGKTTQICQYLWREGFGNTGLIICTQPRKIAAMTVAKYVSSQVGCSIGGIVGYQVGLSKKFSEQTKILYVTDFTMLKMCLDDPRFDKVSCLIIDEAHERTVYTDLLLGMVKDILQVKPELRLIITSATLKINIFQSYFKLPDDAILSVSGRTFPVEDVWLDENVHLGWNYFERTVDTVWDVLRQEPGDILAFLATPVETEKAVEKFTDMVKKQNYKSKLLVYQLHGKLDPQEHQKVFEKTPAGARKVVFATNCAETSVTIPGICYVVDSGMVKEAHYDPVRNINVLAVGFVNKSSAEQRRGRAGRTQSGKCYRLYSHSNYEHDMADNMVPEILRINLGQALLKLMLLGVKNPLMFDFVESPSKDALSAAVKQLIHLGAVEESNCSLTELGFGMAKLPLEPRLSYLILKGIEEGIGYKAIIIAALATVSRNIFFRNMQNKDDADLKKVRFCQSESDFLTFLEIYKEWSEVPKSEKARWCVLNCINNRSMRLAHELVNELILTFSNDLGMKISTKFTEENYFLHVAHRILFHAFSENLCVFSGHRKIGYLSLNVPGSLHIHPSSSLYSLGNWRPKYIVYDAILKTSQVFLINITVVEENLLENSINEGLIPINLQSLASLCPAPYTFSHLGSNVLKNIIGNKGFKLKILENALKEVCGTNQCAVDACFSTGQLNVYAPLQFHDSVKEIFLPIVNGLKMQLLNHEKVINDFADIPSLSAIVGAGCKVYDVVLCGEYRDVVVRPENCDISLVVNTLEKFGEVISVKEAAKCKYVTFRSVESAKRAVKALEGNLEAFSITPGSGYASSVSDPLFKIRLTLIRRPCVGRVFFSVLPLTSVSEVYQKLSNTSIYYKLSRLHVVVSKKCRQDLCIQNVPENVIESDLKSLIFTFLPQNVTFSKFIVERKKEFESNKLEIDAMRCKIIRMFSSFTSTDKLRVELKPPKPRDKEWRAFVFFSNPHDGQNVTNILKPSSGALYNEICRDVVEIKPMLEVSLFCSKEIFSAIQNEIEDALQFFNKNSNENNELTICARNADDGKRVYICISSNNLADIINARKTIQTSIQGDPIECSGNAHLEKLFTSRGKEFLLELGSKTPNSFININHHSKIISIFGSVSSCSVVKSSINQYLDSLEVEDHVDISLKSPNTQRSILKEVIKRYGLCLEKLCTTCNLSSAVIKVDKHVLTVSGSENAISQCQREISEILAEIGDSVESSSTSEECPVCHCEVVPPFHRLEYCGHAYCEVCILSQLQCVEETPILCCVEGCNQLFVLDDIMWACKKVKALQGKIHSKAFESFVKQSHDIKYCPSPDCSMIYRMSTTERDCRITCSLCANDICTKCGVIFHAGMNCDMYQNFRSDDDYSLQVWLRGDSENRKLCPSCRTPIEKNGGCMHMTCWKCGCHMCWRCMKTFEKGDDVYYHQPVCRGSVM